MNNLTGDSQEQVIKFIKFFRSKREVALDQMSADFRDTKNDQLQEDMVSLPNPSNFFSFVFSQSLLLFCRCSLT